jgi:hypothetical protein
MARQFPANSNVAFSRLQAATDNYQKRLKTNQTEKNNKKDRALDQNAANFRPGFTKNINIFMHSMK